MNGHSMFIGDDKKDVVVLQFPYTNILKEFFMPLVSGT